MHTANKLIRRRHARQSKRHASRIYGAFSIYFTLGLNMGSVHRISAYSITTSGRVAMKLIFLVCLLLGYIAPVSIANAETFVIEGSDGLPVSFYVIRQEVRRVGLTEEWLKEQLAGKEELQTRVVITSENSQENIVVITAIPKTSEYSLPEYVVRYGTSGRMDYCLLMSSRFAQLLDCSLDNRSVVRARAECSAEGGTWDLPRGKEHGVCISGNEHNCVAQGGVWQRVCMSQSLACLSPYPDANKECFDNSDCQGGCLDVGNQADTSGRVSGKCKATNNPCGCFTSINKGQRSKTRRCVD